MHVYRHVCAVVIYIYNIPLCLNKTQLEVPRRSGVCRIRVERRNTGGVSNGCSAGVTCCVHGSVSGGTGRMSRRLRRM